MKAFLLLLIAIDSILLTQHHFCTASYLASCSVDSDCSLANEKCLSLSVMGCTKGYCLCKDGKDYDYNRTACVATTAVTLGGTCTGADFEKHVEYAGCYYGISTCYTGFTQSGSLCTFNFGKSCTNTSDCGLNTALNCTGGTCQCLSAYTKSTSTGLCVLKDAGASCTSDSDCWALSPTAGVGFACSNGACGCSTGYKVVQITDIDINESDGTMKATSASYCFSSSVSSTFNVGQGSTCQIWPYSQSTAQVSACDVKYGCYVCPEDTVSSLGYGFCRSTTKATSTSSGTNSTSASTKSTAVSISRGEMNHQSIITNQVALFGIISIIITNFCT